MSVIDPKRTLPQSNNMPEMRKARRSARFNRPFGQCPFAYSALMPADLKTLPHFSLSLTTNLPNSAGVIDTGKVPS